MYNCNGVIVTVLFKLCNLIILTYHQNHDDKHIPHSQKINCCLTVIHLHWPWLLHSSQANSSPLYVIIDLFKFSRTLYEWNHLVCAFFFLIVWLLPLNTVSLGFIHIVCVSVVHSCYFWAVFHCMSIQKYIHSLIYMYIF